MNGQDPLFNTARVATLHTQLGTLIAAANYAVGELARHEQDADQPHLARALNVLRDALGQVTS